MAAKAPGENHSLQQQEKDRMSQSRDTEDTYLRLVELSFDGIAIHSDGRILFINPAGARLLGAQTPDQLIGKSILDFVHPEYLTVVEQRIQKVTREGIGAALIEEKLVRLDEKEVDVEVTAAPTTFAGKPAVQVVFRDVTERKSAERALRELEQEYRALVEQSLQGLVILGADGVLFANSVMAEMMGYTVEEMVGFSSEQLTAIVHPDDQGFVWGRFRDRLAGKPAPQRYEFRLVRKDGTALWVEMFSNRVEYRGSPAVQAAIADISERKRLTHEVEERRLYLESVLAYAPDAIVTMDAQHHIMEWNPGAEELFGYAPAEAIGRNIDELITASDTDVFEQATSLTRQVLAGESVPPIEAVRYRKDGSPVDVIVAGSPILIAGKVAGVVAVYTDIGQYKQAQAALLRYAERLRTLHSIDGTILAAWSPEEVAQVALRHIRELVPCMGAGVALFDFDAQMTTIFALDIDGTLGIESGMRMPMGAFVDTQTLGRGKAVVENDVSDPSTSSPAIQALYAKGLRSYIAAPLIARGRLIGTLALGAENPNAFSPEHVDIIQEVANQIAVALHQARLRAALEAEQHRLEALIEHLPEGVLLLDDEQRILLANPAARASLPVLATAAGPSTASVGDVLTHLADRPIHELLRPPAEEPWHTVETPGPPRRIFDIVTRPIAGETAAGGWVVLIRDITEEREARERVQLQERLAAVGQLAGGIAHDFNNLLTTIMLYAQLPLRKPNLAPDVARALETILSESRQATTLVQQILDFSRHSPIQTRPVDLRPFITEAVRVLQRTIPENISFLQETGAEEHTVNADPTRIQQVLMNLVVNARDAMPDGGTLCITLSKVTLGPSQEPPAAGMSPGQWICLAVSDTGTGIHPDVLPHIFDPFFTTKPPGKGVGLGLAQVYGIVEQHGGSIGVETQVGQGTTFRIYLPSYQVEQAGAPQEETALAAPPGGGETIMLVEDNEKLREAAREFLDSLGYRVLTAAHGQEALAVYRSAGPIDLVITDVVMPEMGGKELIQELRRLDPHLRALAITGHMLAEDLEDLREEGILDVLSKPLNVDALAQAVRAILDPG